MGLALAETLLPAGSEVTIVGRSAERLAAAEKRLPHTGRLSTAVADIAREHEIERLLTAVTAWSEAAILDQGSRAALTRCFPAGSEQAAWGA